MIEFLVEKVFGPKKRAPRLNPPEPLVVNCSGPHGDFIAPVLDISVSGMCIGTSRTVAKGEELGLRMMIRGRHLKARGVRIWQGVRNVDGSSRFCCGLKIVMAADDYDLLKAYVNGDAFDTGNKLLDDLKEMALRPADIDEQIRKRMLSMLVEKSMLAPFHGQEPLVRYFGSVGGRRAGGEQLIGIISKVDAGSHGVRQFRTTFSVRQRSSNPTEPHVSIKNIQALGRNDGGAKAEAR